MVKNGGTGAAVLWLMLSALAAAPLRAACTGDCNVDGVVTWRELVLAGDRAVGKARNCPSADANNDGQVYVEEVVLAASNLSSGCVGAATRTPTPTRTRAATSTATRSPTPESPGPVITYFGLASADNHVINADVDPAADGTRIFTRPVGTAGGGFIVFVEARPGSGGAPVGTRTTPEGDPRPDLQIQANRALGNGSSLVCDNGPLQEGFPLGGVPGIDPPSFDVDSQLVTDVLVDFGCRFSNNTGEWCTLDAGENPNPVTPGPGSGLTQFCSQGVIGVALHFPPGETLLTVRVRDFDGNIGSPARIIVRAP